MLNISRYSSNSCEGKFKLTGLGESSEGNNDNDILQELGSHFVSLKLQFSKADVKEVAITLRFFLIERDLVS